ncbi:MAG: DUF881 domain-containing protein [Eubacteriales bacterium]
MKRRMSLSSGAIIVFFVLGLLIALQLKNINANNLQAYYAKQDLTELQDQVMTLMRENSDLSDQNQNLSDLIASMGDELSGDNKSLQTIMDEKLKAEIFAGLTDVSGSGIQVVMEPGTDVSVKASRLLLLVNELRSSGALAISINDDRIVAMTEIRDTGSTNPQIVINGNSYPATSQFIIRAIYKQEDINRGLQLVNNLIGQLQTVTIMTVSSSDTISIPKLSEDSLTNREI